MSAGVVPFGEPTCIFWGAQCAVLRAGKRPRAEFRGVYDRDAYSSISAGNKTRQPGKIDGISSEVRSTGNAAEYQPIDYGLQTECSDVISQLMSACLSASE